MADDAGLPLDEMARDAMRIVGNDRPSWLTANSCAHYVLDLVAEVRRLRAEIERLIETIQRRQDLEGLRNLAEWQERVKGGEGKP